MGPIHPDAVLGIQAFNLRDYFNAHEHLETAWRDEKGAVRDLYRGILQVGLAYYHVLRGNYAGAVKMFDRSKLWLAPFPAVYRGIDVAGLRSNALRAEGELLHLGAERMAAFNISLMRPLVFSTTTKDGDG